MYQPYFVELLQLWDAGEYSKVVEGIDGNLAHLVTFCLDLSMHRHNHDDLVVLANQFLKHDETNFDRDAVVKTVASCADKWDEAINVGDDNLREQVVLRLIRGSKPQLIFFVMSLIYSGREENDYIFHLGLLAGTIARLNEFAR